MAADSAWFTIIHYNGNIKLQLQLFLTTFLDLQ